MTPPNPFSSATTLSRCTTLIALGMLAMTVDAIAATQQNEAQLSAPGQRAATAQWYPYFTDCSAPQYPRMAIMYELEGVTKAVFKVTDDGGILPQVRRSSGWRALDNATIAAMSKCRATPALIDMWKTKKNTFSIEYVWRLDPDEYPGAKPVLIANSCGPSEQFRVGDSEGAGATLLVRSIVNAQGKVTNVLFERRSEQPEINEAAIAFAKSCRFSVTLKNGEPVRAAGDVLFQWIGSASGPN